MSNPFSKVCVRQLPGNLFQTAIDENHLAIESRDQAHIYYTVLNLSNGEVVAELSPNGITPWHSLHSNQNEFLFLQCFENKKNPDLITYFALDLTNQNLEEVDAPSHWPPAPRIPAIIRADTPEFGTVKQFIGSDLVLGCEYDEWDKYIVVSYYRQHSDVLSRHLLVLYDGEENYHEIQDRDLKGFAPGSFFTHQNRLIFVRNKTEINIYEM